MAMSIRRYFAQRLVYLFITLLLILSFNFFLFHVMPGDPVRLIFPRSADPETLALWKHILGYDKPLLEQYVNSIIHTFQFNFGTSIRISPHTPISDLLPIYILRTLFMVGFGTAIAILIGQVWGAKAAWKKGSLFDQVSSTVSVIFYSIPTFLYAIFLIMMFAFFVPHWPLMGSTSPGLEFDSKDILGKIIDILQHSFLPLMAIVIESIAGFSLIVRSALLDVLQEDYIITAEAKGLSPEEIQRKHAMPNARLPIVANIAISVGWIIGGEVMIEYIFTYKGIGYLSYVAVITFDFPVLESTFFIMTISVLIANFISDILNFYLDPRVRV
jgi:peptide/nickel transport system permease protein